MPVRWLSRRGHQQNTSPLNTIAQKNTSDHEFDFAFSSDTATSLPTALPPINSQTGTRRNNDRPTSSSGLEGRTGKRFRVDVQNIRPQTSADNRTSQLLTHRHGASRSHDDLIGVAFGSPGHPPVAFQSMVGQMSPRTPEHAFGHHGPFPEKHRRLFPKSWKKIGAIFHVRHGKTIEPASISGPTLLHRPYASRSDESLSKPNRLMNSQQTPHHPTRDAPPPPPPPQQPSSEDRRVSRRKSSSEGKTMFFDQTPLPSPNTLEETRKSVEHPTRLSSLPKLEINIPVPSLNKKGVVLKNGTTVSGPSSLLERRSKAARTGHRPAQSDSSQKTTSSDDVLPPGDSLPARRMTDSKLPKPDFRLKTSTSSPTVSKYSLFPPSSPVTTKVVGKIHHESPLKRSATSPARISPMQPSFLLQKQNPKSRVNKPPITHNEQDVVSPEANTATTEGTETWSAVHSMQSSVSSSNTDEIFFDIKSFRDSKGMEDGEHYVMARPNSTVVQLARTRSKLNGNSRSNKQSKMASLLSKPMMPAAKANKHVSVSTVDSAVFDEAIAAVEELTSPQATRQSSLEVQLMQRSVSATQASPPKPNVGRQSSLTKQDLNLKLLPPDPVLPAKVQGRGKSDQDGRITVPSPIIEEKSPISTKHLSVEKPTANIARSRDPSPVVPQATSTSIPEQKSTKAVVAPVATVSNPSVQESVPTQSKSKSQNTGKISSTDPAMAKSPQMKAIRRADHPIEESPTIPQGPPPRPYSPSAAVTLGDRPPPVPVKDAKFIPISKFASKNIVKKVEQAGVKPARLTRSATDTIVAQAHETGKRLTGMRRAERSATIPSPRSKLNNVQEQSRSSPQLQQTKSSPAVRTFDSPALGQNGVHTVTAVVQAPPAAEVSVARTISLSRKQSAKVLVPGPRLAARRKEEEERRAGEASPAATPVLVTVSSPEPHKHNRKASVSNSVIAKPSGRSTPDIKAKLNPLGAHPTDSQISLVSHASAQSWQSEVSTMSKAQQQVDKQLVEKYKDKDKSKWDVVETKRMSPVVVVQGEKGHKPGMSVGIVLDVA